MTQVLNHRSRSRYSRQCPPDRQIEFSGQLGQPDQGGDEGAAKLSAGRAHIRVVQPIDPALRRPSGRFVHARIELRSFASSSDGARSVDALKTIGAALDLDRAPRPRPPGKVGAVVTEQQSRPDRDGRRGHQRCVGARDRGTACHVDWLWYAK